MSTSTNYCNKRLWSVSGRCRRWYLFSKISVKLTSKSMKTMEADRYDYERLFQAQKKKLPNFELDRSREILAKTLKMSNYERNSIDTSVTGRLPYRKADSMRLKKNRHVSVNMYLTMCLDSKMTKCSTNITFLVTGDFSPSDLNVQSAATFLYYSDTRKLESANGSATTALRLSLITHCNSKWIEFLSSEVRTSVFLF